MPMFKACDTLTLEFIMQAQFYIQNKIILA